MKAQRLGDQDSRVAEAAVALQAGETAKAKELIAQALKRSPASFVAHTLAGAIADRENDLKTAERHFAAAARLAPGSADVRNNYGAILLRQGRRAEASREFAASLRINPSQTSTLVNLAKVRLEDGDLRGARTLFERTKTAASDAEIARALLLISLSLRETERAREEYKLFASLAASPKPAERVQVAKSLSDTGLYQESETELRSVLGPEPQNVDALILLSRLYLKQKNVPAAGKLLESAVAGGLTTARVYAALAEVYEAGGYYENAIPAMRLAIEAEPKNEHLRVRYGLLLIDSKAPAAAIIRLGEALKEFPVSAKLWLVLGMAQQADGKSVAAQGSFEQSLKLDPRSIPALGYRATIETEQGRYDAAAATYRKALAIDEKSAVLHYLLADVLLKIPNIADAAVTKHLSRALELDPDLAPARLALGKHYTRTERWQLAAVEFEKAAKLAPDVAEAHYQLGRVLARLRRTEESRAAFDKYKALNDQQKTRADADRKEMVRRLADVRF